MSGPKIIVYNVTPQMEERWRREIRQRLTKMEGHWKQQRRRMQGFLAQLHFQADGASVKAIQDSIALIDQRFIELQDPVVIDQLMRDIYRNKAAFAYLSDEIERLHEQVAAVATQANQRERSMQAAVKDLATRLATAGLMEERNRLLQAPSETALQEATEALSRVQQNERDRAFHKAIEELGPTPAATFLPSLKTDSELERVEQQMVRLELLNDGPGTQNLRARLMELGSTIGARQRRLLLDSLVLEISDAVTHEREAEQLQVSLDGLEARLGVFEAAPQEFQEAISALRQKSVGASALAELSQRVESWCEQEARNLDSQQVRNLVLGSLRNLGYDVREGMQTGWVKGGSIVLQKPGSSDYAVELQDLSGNLRSRVVRFGDPVAPVSDQQRQRDSEMEQQWCQSHTLALAALRNQGVDAEIMAKREPGEVPLEVIRTTDVDRPVRAITDPGRKTLGSN